MVCTPIECGELFGTCNICYIFRIVSQPCALHSNWSRVRLELTQHESEFRVPILTAARNTYNSKMTIVLFVLSMWQISMFVLCWANIYPRLQMPWVIWSIPCRVS